MTPTQARLAELDAISRQRPLTDEEQMEVVRRAQVERKVSRARERRRMNPEVREKIRARCLAYYYSKGKARRAEARG